ncbi:MAG: DUF3539 family protein [Synechococcaceae cyanobacterium SM2_3_1]|nr:DUF3539 family protein [Synechococcaceae cyanobacterium SM2_3_1]
MQENYLSHPTFGLLYSLSSLGEKQALYTTLYAQRLFFRVSANPGVPDSKGIPQEELAFEPISRNSARQLVEERIRMLRRENRKEELLLLQSVYQRTFV